MGVKFGREYKDIITDFSQAIHSVDGIYEFFEMSEGEWMSLNESERNECIRTMADDMFYGLGAEPTLKVGLGSVKYDKQNHIIKVFAGDNVVHVVNLV